MKLIVYSLHINICYSFCIHHNIFFTAQNGLGLITLFVQYYSADLPPPRPLCGETPGRVVKSLIRMVLDLAVVTWAGQSL